MGLKYYFSITCMSFTLLVLLYVILDDMNIFTAITPGTIYILLAMTVSISLLMSFTDRLVIANPLGAIIVQLLVVLVVVFAFGISLGLFPMDWVTILIVLGMIVVVYFGVFGINLLKDRADANKINKQLSKKNRGA